MPHAASAAHATRARPSATTSACRMATGHITAPAALQPPHPNRERCRGRGSTATRAAPRTTAVCHYPSPRPTLAVRLPSAAAAAAVAAVSATVACARHPPPHERLRPNGLLTGGVQAADGDPGRAPELCGAHGPPHPSMICKRTVRRRSHSAAAVENTRGSRPETLRGAPVAAAAASTKRAHVDP
jgi:hypothetical protein